MLHILQGVCKPMCTTVWFVRIAHEHVSLCSEALPQTSTAVIVGGVIGAVIGIIIIAVVTYLIIRRQEPNHDYEGYVSVSSEPCV